MYQMISENLVKHIESGSLISLPAAESYGFAYEGWLAEGNTPAPIAVVAPVNVVTMRQARLALLEIGKLASVQAAIDSLPEPQKSAASIEWEYSQVVQKDKALVQMLAPALGLSSTDLNNLFALAASK